MLASTGKTTVGVSVAMVFLATMALALRFAAKHKGSVKVKLEDGLIILAYLTFVANVATILRALVEVGGTLDFTELGFPTEFAKLDTIFYYSYYGEAFFLFSITFTKFSVLLFFRSIFSTATFKKQSWVLMAFCGLWFVVCLLVNCFQCTPVAAAWKLELQLAGLAKCIVLGDFLVGLEVSNIFLDLCIVALPMAHLRTMKMDMARKIVIGGIFGLVILVCVFGIIRIYYLHGANFGSSAALSNGVNWSIIELSVAILCACLPTYAPLVPISKLSSKVFAVMPNTVVSKKQPRNSQYVKHSYGKELSSANKNGLMSVNDNHNDSHNDTFPLNSVHIQHEYTVKHESA